MPAVASSQPPSMLPRSLYPTSVFLKLQIRPRGPYLASGRPPERRKVGVNWLPPFDASPAEKRRHLTGTVSQAPSYSHTRVGVMTNDLRIAQRQLKKSPGFAVTAILTLALGIGANAVVFSVLSAVVLRPVKVPNAQNLYMVQRFQYPSQSYPDYVDLRDRNRTFESLMTYNILGPVGVNSDGKPSTAWPLLASSNYFDALGIQPYLGRFFHAGDEHGMNSAHYLVLSYAYWHDHFHDDAGVVGRVVEINKRQLTILGVAPPAFRGT